MTLKEKLLNIGLVDDNEFLDKYVELINARALSNRIKFETEGHHIVPAFYYRSVNLAVDSSVENIAILYNKDHILAHLFLALCASSKYADAAANSACRVVTGHEGNYSDVESAIDLLDFELLQQISEQRKHAIAQLAKLRKPNKGLIWINNDIENKMIDPRELEHYTAAGFKKGRMPLPQSGIEKMRMSRKGQKPSSENIAKRKATMIERYGTAGMNHCTEDSNKKISGTLLKYYTEHSHVSAGKISICNKKLQKIQYVLEEDLPQWIEQGWERGRNINTRRRIIKDGKVKIVKEEEIETWLEDGWVLQSAK